MPADGMAIPSLNLNILKRIVTDAAALCPHVIAVGVVGSFARNEQQHASDVDLLIKTDHEQNFQEALQTFGNYVCHVLDYQFNKRLDIIRYSLALSRAGRDSRQDEIWFYRPGYEEMLKEVIWLYERPDNRFSLQRLMKRK